MIKAVLFDCDGVLIDSETLALEVEIRFLADRGLDFERLDFARQFIGTDSRAMDRALKAKSEQVLGTPFDQSVIDDMRELRDRVFEKELMAIAGADKSLTAFKGKRAVASSSRHVCLRTNLTKTNLAHLVYPDVYSAEDVQAGKPAPDVFLHAAKSIGVAPANCLVIEDSINGTKAGIAAGMTVWGFLGGGHVWPELGPSLTATGASRLVSTHEELSALLTQIDP